MCFYSQLSVRGASIIKKEWGLTGEIIAGNFSGFEHPFTSVITDQKPSVCVSMQWGLIPNWAKDTSFQNHTLNAKIETLYEKPSFRDAKRCLVFADSFYEWKWLDTKGKNKQKHEISLDQKVPFVYAGVWDEWWDNTTNEKRLSYAIVTTEAQGIMREIHNSKFRMPVVVSPEEHKKWLSGGTVLPIAEFQAISLEAQGQFKFW